MSNRARFFTGEGGRLLGFQSRAQLAKLELHGRVTGLELDHLKQFMSGRGRKGEDNPLSRPSSLGVVVTLRFHPFPPLSSPLDGWGCGKKINRLWLCYRTFSTFSFIVLKKDSASADWWGLLLLLGSLTFDGLTGTQTDKQHKATKRDFAYPGMFVNNSVGFVLSAVIYTVGVVTQGDDTHWRILADQQLLWDCIMVGLTGSIGQVFIFFCISVFDCYLLSVITTTRKFFSVVYSNFRFGH